MMKCPFCQFENEDGALFCEQCKTDLGVETAAPAAPGTPLAALADGGAPVPASPMAQIYDGETVPEAQVAAEGSITSAVLDPTDVVFAESPAEPVSFEPAPEAVPVAEAVPAAEAAATQEATSAPEPPTALSAPATMAAPLRLPEGVKPRLIVLRGQRMHQEYPIYEGENYIGRADDKPVDVDLEDQEPPDRIWSSRQHAVIVFEDGVLAIEDLNSTNGTFVNRTRVQPGQKRPLQVNDVIQIGTVQMKVKV